MKKKKVKRENVSDKRQKGKENKMNEKQTQLGCNKEKFEKKTEDNRN